MPTLTQSSPPQQKYPSLLPRLVAGSIGSLVTSLAITPLEVVKVRQQAASSAVSARPCPSCGTLLFNNGLMECLVAKSRFASSAVPEQTQRGTFAMLRFIFAKEGLGGLYAGLAPTLVMSVPNTVLYFTTYDELYARLVQRWRKSCNPTITTSSSATPPPDWIPLVSGSSARLVATLATAPLELVRTRQAMWQQSSSSSWRHELQHLIQTQGITSVFVGVRPTLYRDVPFSAIYWLCLERFRRSWKIYNEKRTVSTLQHFGQAFVNGAVSGMIASACTTPLDVVKTRIQTMTATNTIKKEVVQVCHHHYARGHETTPIPSSTLQLLRDILRQEGVAGLWRGNTTRMLKVAPACAIMISCYEVTKLVVEESTT